MGLFRNKHSIGKTIAQLRKEKGWTQIELAEKLQVSDKAVSKWEKDSGTPSIEFFPALAEIFGVSIDYIMTGKNANEINKKLGASTTSEKLEQEAELKQNWGKEEERKIASVLENGIINIDKLLEYKDVEFIKKAFAKYPIHVIEQLNTYFQQKNWRALFEFAVDNNDEQFANAVVKGEQKDIEKELFSYWSRPYGTKASHLNINSTHLYFIENATAIGLAPCPSTSSRYYAKNIEDATAKLQVVKKRIIDELTSNIDKEKAIKELTKEYFESELAKGNTDMVVVKLCVRLEAILRCYYHNEGDFADLLNRYCRQFSPFQNKPPLILNKLRKQRNGIVYSEKCNETLTIEELKWCIDHICKMS